MEIDNDTIFQKCFKIKTQRWNFNFSVGFPVAGSFWPEVKYWHVFTNNKYEIRLTQSHSTKDPFKSIYNNFYHGQSPTIYH